ncbi:MAG: nicotinate-nucleotide adenylyltransferase [Gammaproteobacteria bacterium]|nr:nicotinate-nucleotide adenylyltransferase [Gammaproteobacteria bacterium]MCY4254816.1 nicotinate-nucleotide adenylyltransferase [Gammaproteobacteria bacterium]MCY4341040.1 nicotinate-nucleotide adenylyltransferase [Gammaproteobacteria bacterium]
MSGSDVLGLMGGAFDPVHKGHIELARKLAAAAEISEVRFVIAARPPHRGALMAGASLRRRMLEAAIADIPGYAVEDCELEPSGPRYTVDTLSLLRRRYPSRPLCWMMGFDSFAGLPQWRDWRTLFDLAHFVVGARIGYTDGLSAALEREIAARSAAHARELRTIRSGRILMCAQPVAAISASRVRKAARAGRLESDLIPAPVARIIRESGAYAEGSP